MLFHGTGSDRVLRARPKESAPPVCLPLPAGFPSLVLWSRHCCGRQLPCAGLAVSHRPRQPAGPSLCIPGSPFLTPGLLWPHQPQTGRSSLLSAVFLPPGMEATARAFLFSEPQKQMHVLERASPLPLGCSWYQLRECLPEGRGSVEGLPC